MTLTKRSPKVETIKVIQSFDLPSLKCCSWIEVSILVTGLQHDCQRSKF